jgi:TonB family protein
MMLLADLTIRSSVILCAGLAAAALMRRRSAALRHHVLAVTLFAAAGLVPLSLTLPAWEFSFPVPISEPSEAQRDYAVPDSAVSARAGRPAREPVAAWPAATITWAVGFVAVAGSLLAGLLRLARLARHAEPVSDPRWLRLTEHVSDALDLKRPVTLLQTDMPGVLATWGVYRPSVLLPAHARTWTDQRIHVVLSHELAHIRRRDWLVQMSAEVLRSLCWYNPLMWMACARLRRESEQACDDVVLAAVPARDYAAHLLELARICRGTAPAWASAMPMARPSTLERRIAAMLNPRLNRTALSRRAIALTAVLLLGLTLPAATLRAGQDGPLPLTGSAYDPSAAVLPGVQLTLEDAQQFRWQASTDAAGRFAFPAVPPGQYVIEASLPGFRQLRHEFQLRTARDWDRAITLQVAEVVETIHVSASRTSAAGPRAQAPGPQRIRVGGNIRAPRKRVDVNPVYPASMREAGLEGLVPIEALIGIDGTVQSVRVRSAQVHPDFATAAVDAVRQWLFDPTLLNGVPVEVVMHVSVRFSLSD